MGFLPPARAPRPPRGGWRRRGGAPGGPALVGCVGQPNGQANLQALQPTIWPKNMSASFELPQTSYLALQGEDHLRSVLGPRALSSGFQMSWLGLLGRADILADPRRATSMSAIWQRCAGALQCHIFAEPNCYKRHAKVSRMCSCTFIKTSSKRKR